MLKNKRKDMTPFQNPSKIKRQPFLMHRLISLVSYIAAGGKKCTIKRIGMETISPPFLLLSEHQGFPDYYLTPLSLYPYLAVYVSDIEGFAAYGRRLYSLLGCIGTRRFTHDINLVKSIQQVTKQNKDVIVIYPEACHSSVGTNKTLPVSVGKLAKTLNIPVVVQKMHGSYLTSPVWDEEHTRKVPLSVSLYKVLDQQQLAGMTATQITEIINQKFEYDEYRWQYENRIPIRYPKRAEGLHRVLYQCPHCLAEGFMGSKKAQLSCNACKKEWQMDEYGRLNAVSQQTEFPHIPDWYEFQRREVHKQINNDGYSFKETVRIEALPNEKGFVQMGNGVLEYTEKGFSLTFQEGHESIFFALRYSLHVEYDYRKKGDAVVLSTRDCCYYLYPLSKTCSVTKIQFASEYLFQLKHGKITKQ